MNYPQKFHKQNLIGFKGETLRENETDLFLSDCQISKFAHGYMYAVCYITV